MFKVYRVYEPFHESSESGTREYGIFSSREAALQRAREMWKKQGYADEGLEKLAHHDGWGFHSIGISEYELDVPQEDEVIGYT